MTAKEAYKLTLEAQVKKVYSDIQNAINEGCFHLLAAGEDITETVHKQLLKDGFVTTKEKYGIQDAVKISWNDEKPEE